MAHDSTSSINYDDINHAKHHQQHIENLENLKPTPSQFEKVSNSASGHFSSIETLTKRRSSTCPRKLLLLATCAGHSEIPLPSPLVVSLANTPAAIDLIGWGGAGGGTGNASAGTGAYFFLGAVLLYAGGIGEWILGNTFPAVVFFTFGGFWGAFGATLTPFFNVINGYNDDSPAFYRSFAMFLMWMAVLCLLYAIAAIRTNICLVAILLCFVVTFPCLTASYFYAADGLVALSNTTRIAGGYFSFIASIIAWYLWFSMVLESVDFPIALPVGDLTKYVKGRSEKLKSAAEMA
ncbi:Protein alcS [Cercospora beticola]|uniref:Protein alcS n=1 Tax=Cercospora beticola TaxID=122368 RepID=A0A2G5I3T8_CERBT|nr:Protein alcS [Cercospora beticola]PIA99153.1 Protein alcS [Cercospora beticola]WPB00273.1 hypothetical protein RHO25_004892 [Cercospora beticola]CAK1361529.1 unnamed protein product [Cercospora beticola]